MRGFGLFRAGSDTPRDILLDCIWLLGLGCLLIASGIGLRDPWPADEPRFALIARDMALTGDWLLPRVAGEIYAEKPPLFFWFIASGLQASHSLRLAFLLPSLLSGLGCVLLVYDLARRLWRRETGLVAGGLLLLTVQFVWQARQAQIDATLCFWTTLSLYALLRHLLLGPQWRWYITGWAAAGFGVITKGVGFLPLLVLIPFACLRSPQWSPRFSRGRAAQWLLGPLAFVLAVSVWLVPMLVAARTDPALATYRNEILFHQTIGRYAHAWHHREPPWYFLVNVIPLMWLPLTALLPWLIPQWRDALRRRDLRIALLLSWVVLVVLFFSFSSGKRGIYVLPAVPALALACAPFAVELLRRASVQRTLYSIAAASGGVCAAAAIYIAVRGDKRAEVIAHYDIDPLGPLLVIAGAVFIACLVARPRRGLAAFGAVLTSLLLVVSFWVNPAMNTARSGADFMRRVEQVADPARELGLVSAKEQYLLNARRPVVHFGNRRWREGTQEAFDAARWLSRSPGRQLIVNTAVKKLCFAGTRQIALGAANRAEWFLIEGRPDTACIDRGHPRASYKYDSPSVPPKHADRRHERQPVVDVLSQRG
jgi:4-amino-4-deoxy-L-arabinose transferase-like glycosyltransferase